MNLNQGLFDKRVEWLQASVLQHEVLAKPIFKIVWEQVDAHSLFTLFDVIVLVTVFYKK